MREQWGGYGKLRDGDGVGWEIKKVLHAGDTVLVAERIEHLQHIVNEFERACDGIAL